MPIRAALAEIAKTFDAKTAGSRACAWARDQERGAAPRGIARRIDAGERLVRLGARSVFLVCAPPSSFRYTHKKHHTAESQTRREEPEGEMTGRIRTHMYVFICGTRMAG